MFLSTDASSVNSVQIIQQQSAWTGSRNYNEESNNNPGANFSALIPLIAGQSYYFTGYHAEGGPGQNFAVTANFIPEPSSVVLLGLGAIGLYIAAQRRRRS